MAEYVVDNAFAYLGDCDFTGHINEWSVDGSFETRRKTTFRNNGSHVYQGGLFRTDYKMAGFADFADDGPNLALWTPFSGRASRTITAGNVETEGQPCVLMKGLIPQFTPTLGRVGDMAGFTMSALGTDGVGGVRGLLLAEQQAVSGTGVIGTAFELGAASASQYLYATLHLLGTVGTSITVVLESDADNTFAAATTRVTFGPLTALGGTWATPVAGAITDTWYRLRATAVTGSWTVAGAAGIE